MKVKCTRRFRVDGINGKGRILAYRLVDNSGKMQDVGADRLKELIKSGRVTVTNLKLTKDDRLIAISVGKDEGAPTTRTSDKKYISSNLECAEKIADILKVCELIMRYIYGRNIGIPPVKRVAADIANHDAEEWKEILADIKEYMNSNYNEEDPDCSAIIHKINLVLDYMKKAKI